MRAGLAGRQTQRLLRAARGITRHGSPGPPGAALATAEETEWFHSHGAAMAAALAGWFFCALFASVAYNWTFYYLLALATAPRELLRGRMDPPRARRSARVPAHDLREAQA